MKLFWAPGTRASRVLWMLEELGRPYKRIPVSLGAEPAPEDFAAASPMNKVPALVDGEVMLAESAAICLYLADRYAAGALAPPTDHVDRGRFLYWMFFTPGVIEPCVTERVQGWPANPRQHGWGDFDSMIQALDQGLAKGPWLLGNQFTAADVMVASSVNLVRTLKLLPEAGNIRSYLDRCLTRKAYQRVQAIEAELGSAD